MAFNFKVFWDGIKIKAKSVLTSDSKGELEVSDTSGKLNYHDGLTRSPVVTESHSSTLTNKTIDADNNILSNLEVDNLKAGVLNTDVAMTGATDSQIPSALAIKTYVDNKHDAQNEASEISYDNSTSGLTATNVQDAIDQVEARVDTAETDIIQNAFDIQAHITDSSDAHDASAISNVPAGNLAATDVQSALNELQSDIDTRATSADLSAHITDTTDAHDASAISVIPNVDLLATDVQAALEELQTEVLAASGSASGVQANLDAHINDTTDAHDASAISVVPAGNLAADDVQEALIELQTDVDTRATTAALTAHTSASTGVHGVTGSVVGTTDSQTLTNKTIDADLNTISNIDNADIKAAANIARTKLASGTANTIVVNDASGVMSEMANATHSANAITLTNLKHLELQSQDDTTTTGANATLATFTAGGVRLTNNSLTSVANIPVGANGQQFILFNRTGVSVTIKDASAALGTAAARILTGTGADITLAADAALILSYDSISSRWQVVGGSGGGGSSEAIDINYDNTASGLDATNVQDAIDELQENINAIDPRANELLTQNFETAVLADFTQTGLELVSSPFIHGTKTARLIHQAASTRSFKQTKAVDPKFRGKNNTLRFDARSSAASANVTVLVYDETNSTVLTSSTFTTGQITAAVFNTTNASASVTVTDLSILNSISIGASITGSGIPTGTVVTAKGTNTLTLSQNATATATGVSLKVSALPNIQNYSFNIPSNCASLSYTISALQEAGLPETYIDDIVIELTEQALSSASVTVPKLESGTVRYVGAGLLTTTGNIRFNASNITSNYNGLISYDSSTGYFTALKKVRINGSITLDITTAASAFDVNVNGSFRQRSNTTTNATTYKATLAFNLELAVGDYVNFSTPATLANSGTDSFTFTFESLDQTESKTIPLTSSVLVTEPDSEIQFNDFSMTKASVGTAIFTLGTPGYQHYKGNAVRYVKDAINGDYFEALKSGLFSFGVGFDNSIASTTPVGLALSKNSTQLTTPGHNINVADKLAIGYYTDVPYIHWSGLLNVGDKIRIHEIGNVGSSSVNYSTLTFAYQGSTKILNPSSDQKIEIPTHELRFEGASSRGSTDTAIVKFDTLAKIKGDGFTVVNTAANGTVITIKKAGTLTVDTTLVSTAIAVNNFRITKNQVNLTTTTMSSAESMATQNIGNTSAALPSSSLSATFPVQIGDIIRVSSSVTPTADIANVLNLTLQETSVAVALQNVAPRWDDSDSIVELRTGFGFGSSLTNVRRYANISNNLGTDIEYIDSVTNGATIYIKTTGLYNIDVQDIITSGTNFIAFDQVASPTSNTSIKNICLDTGVFSAGDVINLNAQVQLQAGTYYKVICGTPAVVSSANALTHLYVSKVGKTQGTVDVTPFVQIPTNDVQMISTAYTATLLSGTGTNIRYAINSNTNNGIIAVVDNGTNTVFTALKRCSVEFITTLIIGNAPGNVIIINKNGSPIDASGQNNTTQDYAQHTYIDTLEVGDFFTVSANSALRLNIGRFRLKATAQNNSVVTSTQQVSSDTMNFVFKSTAITDSDPVGTFNTYLYSANSNTSNIQSSAPTQTIASMNTDGIRLYPRIYSAAGTTGQPNRVTVKIGKGLKSYTINGYGSTGKTITLAFDRYYSGTTTAGISYMYDENTGILNLDAGFGLNGTETVRYLGNDVLGNQYSSGYFVFNASKSPSLVSIPNLQQRVAYIKDVKATTADGGTNASATRQTRTLNTLEDPTGLVLSLASNQFTLPAGMYKIVAIAPANKVDRHKVYVRNVTNSTDAIIGSSSSASAAETNSGDNVLSIAMGIVTITSNTVFEIQHYTQTVKTGDGLGANSGNSTSEVYTQVEITLIRKP